MVAVGSLVESVSVGQWMSQRDGEGLERKVERDSEKELGWGTLEAYIKSPHGMEVGWEEELLWVFYSRTK